MPRPSVRRPAIAVMWIALTVAMLAVATGHRCARAGNNPPTAAIGGPGSELRQPLPRRTIVGQRSEPGARSSAGWWLGTAGIAAALAVFGGLSVASRRFLPQHPGGPLRVVGRTSLSPKHTVYLLRAGERTLIIGVGPQGAPSLLGELREPAGVKSTDSLSGAMPVDADSGMALGGEHRGHPPGGDE